MRFELRSLRSESRAITIDHYKYWSLYFIENNHAKELWFDTTRLANDFHLSGEAMLDWNRFRIMTVSELDL